MEKTEALVVMTLIVGVVIALGQVGGCIVEHDKVQANEPKPCVEAQAKPSN